MVSDPKNSNDKTLIILHLLNSEIFWFYELPYSYMSWQNFARYEIEGLLSALYNDIPTFRLLWTFVHS